ncbi:MAG: hypothetical protein OXF58_07735 [Gammaproteobacteria bacterium]|nr:hypothetical protein [Gammaproteobacteria bacterium]
MENEPHRNPATPKEIWATLDRITQRQEKWQQDYERWQQEYERRQQEYERRQQERDREQREYNRRQQEMNRQQEKIWRQMEDTDRRLKKTDELFNSQWSKLVESLVEGDLVALLQARDIAVESTHPRVNGRRNGEHYEFDILAINGKEVVVVEVKTTLRPEDVKHFLAKLAKFTEYEPIWKGKRILGAMAYLKTDESVQTHAQRQGLFVIRATGSSASIINSTDFRPRVFC